MEIERKWGDEWLYENQRSTNTRVVYWHKHIICFELQTKYYLLVSLKKNIRIFCVTCYVFCVNKTDKDNF